MMKWKKKKKIRKQFYLNSIQNVYRSTERVCSFIQIDFQFAHSKVSYPNMTVVVEKDVVQF